MSSRWLEGDSGPLMSEDVRRILNPNSWFGNNDINFYIKVLYDRFEKDKDRFRGDFTVQSANIFVSTLIHLCF